MASNTPQPVANSKAHSDSAATPVIAAVSPAFHRPIQPLPRQSSQLQHQALSSHHLQQQQQHPSSPYTRATQQPIRISSPNSMADPKRPAPRPRSSTINEHPLVHPSPQSVPHSQPLQLQQQQQQQGQPSQAPKKFQQPMPQQSPQIPKPRSSPQQPTLLPQPQQNNSSVIGGGGDGSNINGLQSFSNKSTSSDLPPRPQLNLSPRPPTRPINIPGSGSGHGLRHGPGISPGQGPVRTNSPLVSPSSPFSPLPPPATSGASPSALATSSPAIPVAPVPKARPIPPTLPPARAHGIHARPLARPPSTLAATPSVTAGNSLPSVSTSSPIPPADTAPRSTTVGQAPSKAGIAGTLRTSDPVVPALQAPQQSHQPRQQRQSGLSSVRSLSDAALQPRPIFSPSGPSFSKSPLTTMDSQIPQSVAALPEVHQKSTVEHQESAKSNVSESSLEEEEDDDDDADDDEAAPEKGRDKGKKTRQRKVRKSLERLTRHSLDKKRRSRQIRSLTSVVPPASTSSTVDSTSKIDSVVQTPKRQSLWASLFGNGKTEVRPALVDSLVRNNGSTQSLGSLTTPIQHSQQPSASSTASSSTSPQSEKCLSDTSAAISELDSASLMQSPQSEISQSNSQADLNTPVEDISSVNVVRHDRSRTLPGILPQWESGILWSLSRALSNKRAEAPPLDSDSSDTESDSDSLATADVLPESESRASIGSKETVTEDSASTNEDNEFVDAESNIPEIELAQRSPTLPAPAALPVRHQIPSERIMVAEAQVQIGDDLEDEDPFTDSHAMSATSPSIMSSTSSRGHPSAPGGTPNSSPSPSLSPLSYLTGSAATGSTWSLQGSRQSLMKMIFKSRNDPTSTPNADTNNSVDILPDWQQAHSDGSLGSSSPLTPIRADLFSDFESNGALSLSTEGQSKDMKRRSFVLPGAFPGEESLSQDEPRMSESSFVHEPIPMYAASEGDSLAVVPQDHPSYFNTHDSHDSSDIDDNQDDITSSSDESDEVISTHPSKASYDRSSFLNGPPLPQFNPASTSPNRQLLAHSQHHTSPVFHGIKQSRAMDEQEPLQIQVHSSSIVLSKNATSSSSQPTSESTFKPHVPLNQPIESVEQYKQDKTSPSILAITKPSPGSAGPFADHMSIVSPIASPLEITPSAQPSVNSRPQESKNWTQKDRSMGIGSITNYSRYKEDVHSEPEQLTSDWKRAHNDKASQEDTSDTSYSETNSSGQSSSGSPLVVEVISSGLRSGTALERNTASERTVSPRTKAIHAVMRQPASSMTHMAPTYSQSNQNKSSNPPPIPPPRNARRPRSKTTSRYASQESMRDAFDTITITSISQEPASAARTVIVPTTTESPPKEHIMEEMGSDQARNFNEEDYLYCQNDRMRNQNRMNGQISQGSHGSRDQTYGQPYSEGNSAFDSSLNYSDYQQQQSNSNWQSGQHQQRQQIQDSGVVNSSNEALLVASLRDQIASLSSERDQFYQEAMLLRQKHDMLTNLVNTMGVAVESIQQQHNYSQQIVPEYGIQDQSRHQYEDHAKQYVGQLGRTEDTQVSQFDFGQSSQQHDADHHPIPAQQEEPQLQPRRNHFHDNDIQRTERVRQLSDEYMIQMPRNSEESVRGYYPHQQDPAQDLVQNQSHGFQNFSHSHGVNQTTYSGDSYHHGFDDHHIQDDPLNQYQQQNLHQQQQQAPMSFGEGYDLIPSQNIGQDAGPSISDNLQSGEYYQQQQQIEEEQRHSGLTLQQLKQQHQQNKLRGHQYRHSTDTGHSSQNSQDGYQLVDIITTRPMSGGFECRFGAGGQQAQSQDQFGPTNPFSSNYIGGRPLSMKTPAQDLSSLRPHQGPIEQHFSSGSHLRRHHSMQHPQNVSRPFGTTDSGSHFSQQPYPPHYNTQTNAQRSHQPRPPVWAPQHLKRLSSSSINLSQHQSSSSQQDGLPSRSETGLLLLSSSTSFLEDLHGDTPLISSAMLGDSSLLSNVVQREKVRIEEKTSSENGAAGWSERPFSPVISNMNEINRNSSGSNSMPSFASAMLDSVVPAPVQSTKPRSVTQDEAEKIREQFEDYRANPKRRSGLLSASQEAKDRLRVNEDEEDLPKKWNDSFADATSNSGTDSDTSDEELERRPKSNSDHKQQGEEGPFGTGANLLNRSKTIASTGINPRNGHTGNEVEVSLTSSSTHENQLSVANTVKESLQRHHSVSGSLRTVPRHTQSTKNIHNASQVSQEAAHRQHLPVPPATLPRPPVAAYRGISTNDGLAGQPSKVTATPVSSTSLVHGLLSSSSKAVMDEEGGDWPLQAQPRRYNSGKLGMTGVTGVTRRAIGRPVEKGHGVERGPEDCV
ncbi:hypothetical protein FBU30_001196 [Linnemannia zychae]|nr:hypothetical protein FBU30_001196 [Linnemannia zychae]